MSDEMQEIIEDFIIETQEILDNLDEKFVELEEDRSNQSLLNEIFRSIHTIKGAAGFLGFTQMVELSHATENVLKKLRDGILVASAEIMDVILEAVDLLKVLLEHIKNQDGVEEDLSEIVSKLKAIEEGSVQARAGEEAVTEVPSQVAEDEEPEKSEPEPVVSQIQDEVSDKVQDTLDVKSEQTEAVKKADKISVPQKESISEKDKFHIEQTIRVDVERLDDVLNLVGELVLGRNRLLKIASNLESKYTEDPEISSLSETMAFLNLITSDLQIAVMKTRMQPVKKVFNKFPRMVRDLARSRGKEVDLLVSGEETEVDKSVIENIADPLVHLIRNAIDHGIESKEERINAGKPPKGVIRLSASQEGNNIVIEIEDDGKGIDPEVIKRKAIEKGLLSEAHASSLSDKEALEFIFMPGFSTASKVSDISGRGVGMDVVKTNISRLNGTIDIITEKGKGTRFVIKLPLTLAIIQTLMVQVQSDTYAIPLGSVLETVRISREDIKTIDSQEVIQLRGEILPIVRLSTLFNMYSDNGSDRLYVVVVTAEDRKFGIVVDRLIGQEEVVIKAVEGEIINLKDSNVIAGATITGDGRVVLIVDISMIMEYLNKGAKTYV